MNVEDVVVAMVPLADGAAGVEGVVREKILGPVDAAWAQVVNVDAAPETVIHGSTPPMRVQSSLSMILLSMILLSSVLAFPHLLRSPLLLRLPLPTPLLSGPLSPFPSLAP